MTSIDEYRRHAAACFSLAQNIQDDEDRSRLLEMVEAWLKLATRPVRALKTGDASQG
jgi:hypothetical protein